METTQFRKCWRGALGAAVHTLAVRALVVDAAMKPPHLRLCCLLVQIMCDGIIIQWDISCQNCG